MITYSNLLEAKEHLKNALHHAGLAQSLAPSASISEACMLLEGALVVVTAANNAEREFDDTEEGK